MEVPFLESTYFSGQGSTPHTQTSVSKQGHCQRQTCFELVPDLITSWRQHLITMSTGKGTSTEQRYDGRRAISNDSAFPKVKLTFKGKLHVASLLLDLRMRTICACALLIMVLNGARYRRGSKNPLTALN